MSPKLKHPMQPLLVDEGVVRFKANAIVRFLLDAGPYDLNKLAMLPFSVEDRVQFAQLIGYSACGFCELSYVPEADKEAADEAVARLDRLTKPKRRGGA